MFAGNYAPEGWALCAGQTLNVADHPALFAAIGTSFGGDGRETFALPDLRGRIPVHRGVHVAHGESGGSELADISADQLPGHSHTVTPATGTSPAAFHGETVTMSADALPVDATGGSADDYATGGGGAHDNMQPFLSIHFVIALGGDVEPVSILEPFIGEIRLYAGAATPRGWQRCNGQALDIANNSDLFAVLGTTYGGDGKQTFALPDMRGRVALHAGQGAGLTLRRLGESGGSEQVALSATHLPYHSHALQPAAVGSAAGHVVMAAGSPSGSALTGIGTSAGTVSDGPGAPHNNLQPYLVLNYIIATTGNTSA